MIKPPRKQNRLLVISLLSMFLSSMAVANEPAKINSPYVLGEVLVRFKSETADAIRDLQTQQTLRSALNDLDSPLNRLPVSIIDIEPIVPQPALTGIYPLNASAERAKLLDVFKLSVNPDQSISSVIEELNLNPDVDYAEPNYIVHALASPNDPRYGDQWYLNNTGQTGGTAGVDIKAEKAWGIVTGSSSVIVAIIDSGIVKTHPDLVDNIWCNPNETANGKDSDNNGYVDDICGWDFIKNINDTKDNGGHGSHVAGTIGASCNNSTGVCGVNHHVSLMVLKFLDEKTGGTSDQAVKAIKYAVDNGASIINASWGSGTEVLAIKDAIIYARNHNVLFVAAAGNDGYDNDKPGTLFSGKPSYPATSKVDNIISVAATDHKDVLADFSNYGKTTVHVAAPGKAITNTWLANGYDTVSGTSMASPVVAGIAALMKADNPELTYLQIKESLLDTVDKIPGLSGKVISGGRVNAFKAVSANPGNPAPVIDANYSVAVNHDLTVTGFVIDNNPGATITAKLTNRQGKAITTTESLSKSYSFIFTFSALADEVYTLTLNTTDLGGRIGTVTVNDIVVGTPPNAPPLITLISDLSTKPNCLTLKGTATDNDGQVNAVVVTINGYGKDNALLAANPASPRQWDYEQCSLPNGTYTGSVRSIDNLGDKSIPATFAGVVESPIEVAKGTFVQLVAQNKILEGSALYQKEFTARWCFANIFFGMICNLDSQMTIYRCPESDVWTETDTSCLPSNPLVSVKFDKTLPSAPEKIQIIGGDVADLPISITNTGNTTASAVYLLIEHVFSASAGGTLHFFNDSENFPDFCSLIQPMTVCDGCSPEPIIECHIGNLSASASSAFSLPYSAINSGLVDLKLTLTAAQKIATPPIVAVGFDISPLDVDGDGDTDGAADGDVDGSADGDVDGAADGDVDGSADGDVDGSADGDVDGDVDGAADGDVDGSADGDVDGAADGDVDGSADGDVDGAADGDVDGSADGDVDGSADGDVDGAADGDVDGAADGDVDGAADGDVDGSADGDVDGSADGDVDGDVDGAADGDVDGSADGDVDGAADGDVDGSADGDVDGAADGDVDGSADGDVDGAADGDVDGAADGDVDGAADGDVDGSADGDVDGAADGDVDGSADGDVDGSADGDVDGSADGDVDGAADGDVDGAADGDVDGSADGDVDGSADGDVDGSADGDVDGAADGDGDSNKPKSGGGGTSSPLWLSGILFLSIIAKRRQTKKPRG